MPEQLTLHAGIQEPSTGVMASAPENEDTSTAVLAPPVKPVSSKMRAAIKALAADEERIARWKRDAANESEEHIHWPDSVNILRDCRRHGLGHERLLNPYRPRVRPRQVTEQQAFKLAHEAIHGRAAVLERYGIADERTHADINAEATAKQSRADNTEAATKRRRANTTETAIKPRRADTIETTTTVNRNHNEATDELDD